MKTVLVVDDEFGIAEVLEAILTDEGYRVVTAINGQQGLARLAEAKPDIVLLDLMMPVLDGPSMLRTMKADSAYRDIPVVMMSSLGEVAVAETCSGYAAFLRKPFRVPTVIATVARYIGGSDEETASR